jgi:hypothetical protein
VDGKEIVMDTTFPDGGVAVSVTNVVQQIISQDSYSFVIFFPPFIIFFLFSFFCPCTLTVDSDEVFSFHLCFFL